MWKATTTSRMKKHSSLQDVELDKEDYLRYIIEIYRRTRNVFITTLLLTIVVGFLPISFFKGDFVFTNYKPGIYYLLSMVIDHSINRILQFQKVQIIISSPLSVISICIQLAFVISFLINSPIFIYQFYTFIGPSLYPNEKKLLQEALILLVGMFFLGLGIAYYFVVPVTFGVLTSVSLPMLEQSSTPISLLYTLDEVFSLIFWSVLATGLLYTLPIIIYILVLLGIIDPEYMQNKKKNIIMAIFTFAAIITPDPTLISMLLISIPLILINEVIIRRGISLRTSTHRNHNWRII